MPRAHRFFLPGYYWHITHRCHQQRFLLKFAQDRRRWRHWLFEARKRFGLCVLNYIVTSNHIHLLVKDGGRNEIARSMQLVAGRTAQDYNRRKNRHGAYWEDRYHATAVDSHRYLARCLLYIDLNMVRAGVVGHPGQWEDCGYHELLNPRQRYRIIDHSALNQSLGLGAEGHLERRNQWIADALREGPAHREEMWTESVAVGGLDFVSTFLEKTAGPAARKELEGGEGCFFVREVESAYKPHFPHEMGILSPKNNQKQH